MANRTIVLAGFALLLVVGGVLGVRSCTRQEDVSTDAALRPPASTSAGRDASAGSAAADTAARRALMRRRNAAMGAAVSTLHAYLTALGGDDRAKADAFWSGGKPPARSGEADLRLLENLHALRIQNGTPNALDSEPVPNALEIPVELRASLDDAPMQRYRGWYRLRRAVADDSWEITSATIDALSRAE
jgi:hypothetical protein